MGRNLSINICYKSVALKELKLQEYLLKYKTHINTSKLEMLLLFQNYSYEYFNIILSGVKTTGNAFEQGACIVAVGNGDSGRNNNQG